MSDNKYTITFKTARMGDDYINHKGELEGSAMGHMWYELQKNDGEIESFGFQPLDDPDDKSDDLDWLFRGPGAIKTDDRTKYQEYLPPLRIQINQQQYETLINFGSKEGAIAAGFDPAIYDGKYHNCVQYVFRALYLIGYNPDNEEWTTTRPEIAHNNLYLKLAKYGAILALDENKLTPLTQTNEALTHLYGRDYTIIGYDHIDDEIYGSDGNDHLIGKSGNDVLNGGSGDDTLEGGEGNDILNGGQGDDRLEGGSGHDIYYIGGNDTVIDSDGRGEIRFLDKGYNVRDMDMPTDTPMWLEGYLDSYDGNTAIFKAGEYYRFEARGISTGYSVDNRDSNEEYPFINRFSAASLLIKDLQTGHQVTLPNFQNTQLNILLSDVLANDDLYWSAFSYYAKHGELPFGGESVLDEGYINYAEEFNKIMQERALDPIASSSNGDGQDVKLTEGEYTAADHITPNTQNTSSSSESASATDDYRFNKGQGEQTIYADPKQRHIDTLNFSDARSTHITYQLKGNDLLLSGFHQDTPTDAVRLKGFLNSDHPIKNLQFSDRTLTIEQMQKEGITLSGTAKDDIMYDWHSQANTTFNAGAGNDIIRAGDGDDVLIGGEGNDQLNGGAGSDTYVFANGHGQDVIIESRGNPDDSDMIRFEDALFDDVLFRRDNYDLTLFGYHQNDSITLKSFFVNPDHQIEQFDFADRSLSLAELKQVGTTWVGTDNNDTLTDWEGSANSVLYGGNGNDKILAGDGDDVLIGGKGNDQLNGGRGSDSYLFEKGHGQDMIIETAANVPNTSTTSNTPEHDRLRFTDVNFADVTFRRNNYDLILSGYHQDDAVTIKAFYANPSYQIEGFDFADRSVNWDNNSNSLITASDEERAHYLAAYDKIIHAMAAFGGNSSTDLSLTPQEDNKSSLGLIGASSYLGG